MSLRGRCFDGMIVSLAMKLWIVMIGFPLLYVPIATISEWYMRVETYRTYRVQPGPGYEPSTALETHTEDPVQSVVAMIFRYA